MHYEVTEEIDDNTRIIAIPETENYFDVYGEPEGYETGTDEVVTAEQERNDIVDMINRDGLWQYASQCRCPACGQWETVDSIGMVIGSLDDSGYREDLIASARRHLTD